MKRFFTNNWKYILLALLMYMPIFGNLDVLPIRDYDEGRITINAYEMHKNGDWIVTHYNHSPEMWNTKPPLLMWMQVVLIKLIGFNEIAMRLPSAFAAFFTCLALLIFCVRYLKNEWLGFITVVMLITTEGYVHFHVARTGDFDALLTLFTTAGCLFFYAYCETLSRKFLYLFFLCLTLGVLTKGIAGLLFTPALFLFALITKRVLPILKNKHFYFGLTGFVVLSIGYYLLREAYNPGYIAQVQENELGGRYLVSQGNQPFDFWFYYERLTTWQISDRYLLIPCGLLLGLLSADPRTRKFTWFVTLLSLTYFLIVSAGKTRMEWYIAPLFPYFAIFVALFIEFIFRWLKQLNLAGNLLKRNVVPFIFLFLILIVPYKKIWAKTYTPTEAFYWDSDYYELSYFYKEAMRGRFDLNGTHLVFNGYYAHIQFYVYAMNELGVDTDLINPNDMKEGDRIITYQEELKKMIRDNYENEEKQLWGRVSVFKLLKHR